MKIISHRGYWKSTDEKNKEVAFRRSFSEGFGTETDIRDLNGDLIISHDMPKKNNCYLLFEDFLKIYKEYDESLILALNIKSDGLQENIKSIINKYQIKNYYLFDMSTPDMIQTKNRKLKFLTRVSDLENEALLLNDSDGIWLDNFDNKWNVEKINKYKYIEKKIFIVSEELHGKQRNDQWMKIKKHRINKLSNVILCTDEPCDAKNYFGDGI